MIRTLIFLLVVLSSVAATAQKGINLDFETGNSGKLPGWTTGRLLQTVPVSPAPEKGGRALHLAAPFTNGSGFAYQMLEGNHQPFTRYQLKGKIRTREVEGAGAQLYIYGKEGEVANYVGYAVSESLTGTNGWTEVEVGFETDERVDSIRLGCYLEGAGEAWFDDLSLTALPPAKGRPSATVRKYLDEFFDMVEPVALDNDQIDWKALRRKANERLRGAVSREDTYPTLNYLLKRINKHSFMIPPAQAREMMGEGNEEADPDITYATGRRLDGNINYISMPPVNSGHVPTMVAFADSLQGLIAQLDSGETEGWVLDLRENTGGNCWPMLAGIGPLLGEGVCGYFMDRDGGNAQSWSYRSGASYQDSAAQLTLSTTPYRLRNASARVAVLTGPMTGSSGEVVTVAFRERPQTKSFGQPTAGYSTTNTNFNLSDGAMILLTVSVYADRDKNSYGEEIEPDKLTEDALAAALEWFKGF